MSGSPDHYSSWCSQAYHFVVQLSEVIELQRARLVLQDENMTGHDH